MPRYHVFLGGVPENIVIPSGASPTTSPFIGCIRDVLIDTSVVDFNNVIYQTGVELSTCKVDKVPAKDDDKDQEIFTPKPINPYDETTDPRVNIVEPDPSIEWEVSTLQPPTSSTRYIIYFFSYLKSQKNHFTDTVNYIHTYDFNF